MKIIIEEKDYKDGSNFIELEQSFKVVEQILDACLSSHVVDKLIESRIRTALMYISTIHQNLMYKYLNKEEEK